MRVSSTAGGPGLALALAACAALALALAGAGARAPANGAADHAPAPREVRDRAVPALVGAPREPGDRGPSTAGFRPVAEHGSRRMATDAPRTRPPLATLAGRITRDGRGTRARLRLRRGWNEGVVVETEADGSFRRGALGPGFHLVTVDVAGRTACTRRLFLSPHAETTLELDVATPRERSVRVLDPAGAPLAGAIVELDGAAATTDAAGRTTVTWSASGPPELVVRAPGRAAHARTLDPADPAPEVSVHLEPGCALELRFPAAAPGDALVYLLPREPGPLAGSPPRPATPWSLFSPLRVTPGATVRVDGLPAVELEVRVVHPELSSSPTLLRLDPRHPRALELRPALADPPHPGNLATVAEAIRALDGLPRLQPLERPRAPTRR